MTNGLVLAGEVEGEEVRAGARVEPVAQGVAQKIKRKDGEHDGQGGKHDKVRRVEEVAAGVVEHGAPTGMGASTPRPRKLSVDSARIAPAKPMVACTSTG